MSKNRLKILKENLIELDAEVFICDKNKFSEEFLKWFKSEDFESIAITNEKFLAEIKLSEIIQEAEVKLIFPPEITTPHTAAAAWRSSLAVADAGITSAVAISAETGSALLLSGVPDQRLVSLLPPVHIMLIKEEQVLENVSMLMEEWEKLEGNAPQKKVELNRNESGIPVITQNIDNPIQELSDDPPVNNSAFMVTGPSRTADIEKELVLGVHGPERVIVFIIQ